jgi:hypothetical protein
MSPRKASHSIDRAVGRVDAGRLEILREKSDAHRLLEIVDALDEWRRRGGDPDGLRADLLRLHALAHTLIDVAPISVDPECEAIWELADELESEFLEISEGAKHAISLLEPLTRFAPHDQVGTNQNDLRITDFRVNAALHSPSAGRLE